MAIEPHAEVAALQATLGDVGTMQATEEMLRQQYTNVLARLFRVNAALATTISIKVDDWENLITECNEALETHQAIRLQANENRKRTVATAEAAAPRAATRAASRAQAKGKARRQTPPSSSSEEEEEEENRYKSRGRRTRYLNAMGGCGKDPNI